MELKTGAIKSDLLDAGSFGARGDQLANGRCSGLVSTIRQVLANTRFERGSLRQYRVAARRNDLGVNVAVSAVNTQAHSLQLGNLGPGLAGTAQTRFFPVKHMPPLLLFLGFLDSHHFADITHTLALVRLRLAICTNFGGNLTDLLLV